MCIICACKLTMIIIKTCKNLLRKIFAHENFPIYGTCSIGKVFTIMFHATLGDNRMNRNEGNTMYMYIALSVWLNRFSKHLWQHIKCSMHHFHEYIWLVQCKCANGCFLVTHTHTYTHTHTHTHTHTRTRTHTHTHTRTHAHMRTHTHTNATKCITHCTYAHRVIKYKQNKVYHIDKIYHENFQTYSSPSLAQKVHKIWPYINNTLSSYIIHHNSI